MFKLHYHVSNGGDGSASVHFHATEAEAEQADADLDEGWGEPCNGDVNLKVEDGKLFFQDYREVDGKYQRVWVEVRNGE